jgi:hypothetical protein
MSKLIIPHLNPVKFHKLEPTETAQYLTKHMDEWNFGNTVPSYQVRQVYAQPFQTSDKITLQFQSNFDEADHALELINCNERVFATLTLTKGAESESEAGLFLYEVDEELTGFDEGYFYLRLTADTLVMISEPIHIKEEHPYSVLIEYSNYKFKDGIIWESGIELQARVGGHLKYKQPASKDTFYEDQSLDMTTLDSVPYRIWELYVGGTTGIPDYLIDRINRMLGCSSFSVDGKSFSKSDGSKLEEKSADDYSLRGWFVDLQESENPYSTEYSTDAPTSPPVLTQLTAPSLTLTVDSDTEITAEWPAVANADSYTALIATIDSFAFATVKYSGTDLSFQFTGLTPNKTVWVWVRAEGSGSYTPSVYDKESATTDAAPATPEALDTPIPFTLTANGDDEIIANWPTVAGATGYEFYLNDTNSFDPTTLQYSGTLTTKTVTGLAAGTTQYGWCKALGDGVNNLDSAYATASATTDAFDPTTTTFNTILTNPGLFGNYTDKDAGINGYFGIGSNKEFHFNAISPTDNFSIRLGIKVSGAAGVVVDFPGVYVGQPYKYVHEDLTEHFGTFPAVKTIEDF